jgi:hypothetical protein
MAVGGACWAVEWRGQLGLAPREVVSGLGGRVGLHGSGQEEGHGRARLGLRVRQGDGWLGL